MINKIKEFYCHIHLNYIKEIVYICLSNLIVIAVGVSLFILFKSINYIVLLVIGIIIVNSIIIYRYIYLSNKIEILNLLEINETFMYFYLDINNSTKPTEALVNVKEHCSIFMNDLLVLLLDDFKKDQTSMPFVKFSNEFNSIIVEELLLAVYNTIITNDISIFNKTYETFLTKVNELDKKYYKKQFSFITLTPVISTAIITIIVIISTILLMRGYLNG